MQIGTILYAEDEPDDVYFLELALKRAHLAYALKAL